MNAEIRKRKYAVEIGEDPVTGNIITERWENQNGKLERPGDLPADIEYCPDTGSPIYQRWLSESQEHRDGDKPAVIVTDAQTGSRLVESFSILGKIHRDGDKPAITYRSESGAINEERYMRFGQKHRDPNLGPARTVYNVNGNIYRKEYWFNGVQVEPPQASPELDM